MIAADHGVHLPVTRLRAGLNTESTFLDANPARDGFYALIEGFMAYETALKESEAPDDLLRAMFLLEHLARAVPPLLGAFTHIMGVGNTTPLLGFLMGLLGSIAALTQVAPKFSTDGAWRAVEHRANFTYCVDLMAKGPDLTPLRLCEVDVAHGGALPAKIVQSELYCLTPSSTNPAGLHFGLDSMNYQ